MLYKIFATYWWRDTIVRMTEWKRHLIMEPSKKFYSPVNRPSLQFQVYAHAHTSLGNKSYTLSLSKMDIDCGHKLHMHTWHRYNIIGLGFSYSCMFNMTRQCHPSFPRLERVCALNHFYYSHKERILLYFFLVWLHLLCFIVLFNPFTVLICSVTDLCADSNCLTFLGYVMEHSVAWMESPAGRTDPVK